MQFSARDVAHHTGGELIGPEKNFEGISIDSRGNIAGSLFAALKGDRDGHDFLMSAFENGASGALISQDRPDLPEDKSYIRVEDVQWALSRIGVLTRARLSAPIIAVTGSVGKTTTKDLLSSVLSQKFVTHASTASHNNEIGVPMTLANAPFDTEATVLEMGSRGRGHIHYLCEFARPTHGIITAIEAVHSEVMGDRAAIARAKLELIEHLPDSGTAVLAAHVPELMEGQRLTSARVLTFGAGGEVVAEGPIELDKELFPRFQLLSPWGSVEVQLGLRGEHNVNNALAAAAAGLSVGLTLEQVATGLERAVGSDWRMSLARTASGVQVLNDSYNAGPASMAAALRSLSALPGQEKIAVLGVMAELGATSEAEHAQISDLAAELGITIKAVNTQLYPGAEVFDSHDDVVASIDMGNPGLAILVKGSRVAGLEQVAAKLLEG